jgi:hypothetical protein
MRRTAKLPTSASWSAAGRTYTGQRPVYADDADFSALITNRERTRVRRRSINSFRVTPEVLN